MKIPLDSSPLGLLITPHTSPEALECRAWATETLRAGHEIILPEIIYYETKRELLRLDKHKSLRRLDEFKSDFEFWPIGSLALDKAADFWAAARKRGKPTAAEKALDIDVILAAQAWQMAQDGSFVLIATANQKHLSQFVPAEHWKHIRP